MKLKTVKFSLRNIFLLAGISILVFSAFPRAASAESLNCGMANISLIGSMKQGDKIRAQFSVTYSKDASCTPTGGVVKVSFNCGAGGTAVGPSDLPANTANVYMFDCNYPPTAGKYDVSATVWGSDTSKSIAEATLTQNLNADGTTNDSTGSSGYKTIVTSILSWLFVILHTAMVGIYWLIIMPIINLGVSIQTSVGSCGASGAGTGFLEYVCEGWRFVRDFANMVFILILIVIGIATILRLQAYDYKKLLGKMIIMALLVNFSLVIAQAILKFADIAQLTFAGYGVNAKLLHLGSYLISYTNVTVGGSNPIMVAVKAVGLEVTQVPVLAMEMMNLALSFLSFVAMVAVAFFVLLRIAALIILLILSPFAYALMAFPMAQGLAQSWWKNFIKYAFFTPIMLFFLNLGYLIMMKMNEKSTVFGQINKAGMTATMVGGGSPFPGMDDFLFAMLRNIIVVSFVFGALIVAKKLSIMGADFFTSMGQKALKLPFTAAAVAGGAAGGAAIGAGMRAYSHKMGDMASAAEKAKDWKKADRYKMLSMLNPVVAKQAWEERKKEKEKEAYGHAIGHGRDFLNRYMPTEWHKDEETGELKMGKRTSYARIGEKGILNYKKGEYKDAQLSEEELVKAYLGTNDKLDKAALRQLLIEGRHEDGLRIIEAMEKQKEKEGEYFKKFKAEGNDDDAARRLAKDQVQKDVESGKLDKASFDAVVDKMKEHDWRLANGMSEAESGNISSQNAELGESLQMKRALGEDYYYDKTGTFYSSASRGLWNDIEANEGSSAMLQKLQDLGMENLQVVQTKILQDAAGNAILGEDGKPVEVPVMLEWKFKDKNGVDQKKEITNAADLQGAFDETSRENGVEYSSKGNLRYEVTGAMVEKSGRKRIMRGNQERWAGADEPAAYMEQDENGDFVRFTSAGRRMIINKSPAEVNSFRNSRGSQSRSGKIGAFYVNEQTGKTELKFPKLFLELQDMNKDMAQALTEKNDFSEEEAAEIADKLSEFCKANPETWKNGKPRKFVSGTKGPRGGYNLKEKISGEDDSGSIHGGGI